MSTAKGRAVREEFKRGSIRRELEIPHKENTTAHQL